MFYDIHQRLHKTIAVSYTHLDVYKRQSVERRYEKVIAGFNNRNFSSRKKVSESAFSPKERNEYKKSRAIIHIKCSVHLQATLLIGHVCFSDKYTCLLYTSRCV